MNSTTNPVIAAVADASGEMLALEPQSQHTSGMTVASIRRLIADDSHACTFQSFGQYRTALLRAIDRAMPQSPSSSSSSEAERDAAGPDMRYAPIIKAAINLLAACQERHDKLPSPHKYSVPYAEVVALHDALNGIPPARRFCNKCGYWGNDEQHQRPNGSGQCGYLSRVTSIADTATPPSLPIDFKQASELTDEQITEIARVAHAEGRLSWLGFQKDADGRYTVPVLSQSDYQLVRAVLKAVPSAAPKQASEQGGWRSMETAPKDGEVLLFTEEWGRVVAFLNDNWDGDPFWDAGFDTPLLKPICWMPLHPRPEEGALLLGGDEGGKKGGEQ